MVDQKVRGFRTDFERSVGNATQNLVSRGLDNSGVLLSEVTGAWENFVEACVRSYLEAYRQVLYRAKSPRSESEIEGLMAKIVPILDDSAAQGKRVLKNYLRGMSPNIVRSFESRLDRFYARLRHDLRQELRVEMEKNRLGIAAKQVGNTQ